MGVIRHDYFNATDNIAELLADECGRQAVTVDSLFEHPVISDVLCDATVFTFNDEAESYGMDPWRIVSIDKFSPGYAKDPDKQYILSNYAGTRDVAVSGDTVVFMQKSDLIRAGVDIPESRYAEWQRTRDFKLVRPAKSHVTLHYEAIPKEK